MRSNDDVLIMNLSTLQRIDPCVDSILMNASQVALYEYDAVKLGWAKSKVEGSMFIYARSAVPFHAFTILNRLSTDNLHQPVLLDMEFQSSPPYLLYRRQESPIKGLWFYDEKECILAADLLSRLSNAAKISAGVVTPNKNPPTSSHQPPQPQNNEIMQLFMKNQKRDDNNHAPYGNQGRSIHQQQQQQQQQQSDNNTIRPQQQQQQQGVIKPTPVRIPPPGIDTKYLMQSPNNKAQFQGPHIQRAVPTLNSAPTSSSSMPQSISSLFSHVEEHSNQQAVAGHIKKTISMHESGGGMPPTLQGVFQHAAASSKPPHPLPPPLSASRAVVGSRLASRQVSEPADMPMLVKQLLNEHGARTTPQTASSIMLRKASMEEELREKLNLSNRSSHLVVNNNAMMSPISPDNSKIKNGSKVTPEKAFFELGTPIGRDPTKSPADTSSCSELQQLMSTSSGSNFSMSEPRVAPVLLRPEDILESGHVVTDDRGDIWPPPGSLSELTPISEMELAPIDEGQHTVWHGESEASVVARNSTDFSTPVVTPHITPLTKEQMLQAMNYLLKNDAEFVSKLHEGYIKSLHEQLLSSKK